MRAIHEANIKWSNAERKVICDLAREHDISIGAVIRQALRLYHQHNERLKAGETCTWSGDAHRAKDFAGPLDSEGINDG